MEADQNGAIDEQSRDDASTLGWLLIPLYIPAETKDQLRSRGNTTADWYIDAFGVPKNPLSDRKFQSRSMDVYSDV